MPCGVLVRWLVSSALNVRREASLLSLPAAITSFINRRIVMTAKPPMTIHGTMELRVSEGSKSFAIRAPIMMMKRMRKSKSALRLCLRLNWIIYWRE